MKTFLFSLSFTLLASTIALAELSLPHFFSDHMVLQRDREAAIWGKADAGAEVTVSFKGKSITAKANGEGSWKLEVPAGKADTSGAELTVSSGKQEIVIKDVLVGEVWFASGQSNMYFTMDRVPAYQELIAESNYPGLRMFNAPLVTAVENQEDIEGTWTSATPKTVPGYSAVAYLFARKLYLDLGIPVGVIKSAWGGKPVETFTSREALNSLPGTKALVEATLNADAAYDEAKADAAYQTKLEKWKAAVEARKAKPAAERGKLARKPSAPKRPLDTEGRPGVLYASMIHPFVGYTMRGAIWYQGEGNAKPGAVPYDQTLPLMINDWRERWGDDFSFYYVQLANFRAPSTDPGNNDPWPLLQDRMRLVLDSTPKTGMAIINDIGDAKDIHPKNKKDVGERLARLALAKDYDQDIVWSGPLFESAEIEESGTMLITFKQAGEGLKSRDGKDLQRFEISGDDKVWHWADASVTAKNQVLVRSEKVEKPVAVRYAWAANPEGANLVNSEGLPASVFRTDDWDDVLVKIDTEAIRNEEIRRSLAAEIRELKAKREAIADTKSDAYKEIAEKQKMLFKKFKALTAEVVTK